MNIFLRSLLVITLGGVVIFSSIPAYGEDREIRATANGYSGPINMAIKIDPSGKISQIRILAENETPGVGARICETGFLKQFNGKTADEVSARKGVDAITGATI